MKVAAVQATPVFLDLERSVAKAESLIMEAGRNGAKLVAFPESWIPGYPIWLNGSAAWEDPLVKKAYARYAKNSLSVPSPELDRLCHAAQTAGVTLILGVSERDNRFSKGTLYNSQIFISHTGMLINVRRKLMPTHAERMIWGRGDGSDLQVHDCPAGRVGGLICWEHWMPLARFSMHSLAEQIHIASWPTVLEMETLASRHYAFEGRTFVLCVGAYMDYKSVTTDLELPGNILESGYGNNNSETLMPGGSAIIAPDGEFLCSPVNGTEKILYAEIDKNRVLEEQHALDSVGHYNRPDVFQLSVDTTPTQAIAWRERKSKDSDNKR